VFLFQCKNKTRCYFKIRKTTKSFTWNICRKLTFFPTLFFELDYDECSSNPCLNGGTCVNGKRKFSCICPRTHKEKTCEGWFSQKRYNINKEIKCFLNLRELAVTWHPLAVTTSSVLSQIHIHIRGHSELITSFFVNCTTSSLAKFPQIVL